MTAAARPQWPADDANGTIPTECACGCGTPINAVPLAVAALRKQGLTLGQIAEQLDRTYATVKMARRQVSRYVVGHTARRGATWVDANCVLCGKPVKIPPTTRFKAPRCRDICVDPEIWFRANIEAYDARQAEIYALQRSMNAALRANETGQSVAPSPPGPQRIPNAEVMLDAMGIGARAEARTVLKRLLEEAEEDRADADRRVSALRDALEHLATP